MGMGERARIHLLLLDDAAQGLADVEAGRVKDAARALDALSHRPAIRHHKQLSLDFTHL